MKIQEKPFPLSKLSVLLALTSILGFSRVHGQELYFSNLSDKVQVPASETYNVIQDKQGYIWFATEEGFCCYSNNSLTVYGEKEGLPEKAVYVSTIGPDGKLWIATRDRRILYFDGKKFVEAFFSANYVRKTLGVTHWGYPIKLIFHDNQLMVPDQIKESVIDLRTGEIKLYPRLDNEARIIRVGNDVFFNHKSNPGNYRSIIFPGRASRINLETHELREAPVTVLAGSRILVSGPNCLWDVKENGEIDFHNLDYRILAMKYDTEGNIWIGLQNKGLYFFPHGDLHAKPIISLRGLSVSWVFQDRNGGIWCTTLEKGVFYCQNTKLLSYQGIDELGGRIAVLDRIPGIGMLAIKNGSSNVFLLSDNDVKSYSKIYPQDNYYNFNRVAEGLWLSAVPYSILINEKTHEARKIIDIRGRSYSYGAVDNGKRRILFGYRAIKEWINGKYTRDIYQYGEGRLKNFIDIGGGSYLLYGKNLLLLYASDDDHILPLNPPSEEISCAARINSNEVVIGTRNKGLFIYNFEENSFKQLKTGIPTIVTLSMLCDKRGRLWIGTNKGVFSYHPVSKTMTWVSKKYNLPLTETRQIAEADNRIYFGTNDGVFSLDPNDAADRSTIYPPIVSLKTVHSGVSITADVNFFQKNAFFYYRIEGSTKTELRRMIARNEQLNNLSPGNYTFYGFVQSADGSRSRVVRLAFYIAPTLVQTWWFRVLVIVLFLGLIWLVIKWRVKVIRMREEEKTRISMQLNEFQMSALQAQMNPHFIFNAINTIQSYILTKNKDDAYRYLTKFSNLIRLVLHNSQEKFITIGEELQVINTYLELEQARFSSFTYRINVDPEIDIYETMIPAMLIQPYLENAIWHGLGHLTERQGQLTLNIRLFDDYLQIEVRDNGIGREAAAENKRSTHKSVGISITQQRLETLAQLNEGGIATVEVIDLSENGLATGTLVVIKVSLPDNS